MSQGQGGGRSGGRASDFLGGRGGGADGRRGKIGRTLRGGSPVSQGESGGDPGREPAREKPVRITVDLDAERHRRLKQYALDAGARSAPVIRALLDELDEDPELSARVEARLSAEAER